MQKLILSGEQARAIVIAVYSVGLVDGCLSVRLAKRSITVQDMRGNGFLVSRHAGAKTEREKYATLDAFAEAYGLGDLLSS